MTETMSVPKSLHKSAWSKVLGMIAYSAKLASGACGGKVDILDELLVAASSENTTSKQSRIPHLCCKIVILGDQKLYQSRAAA